MTVIGYTDCPACGKSAEVENGLIQGKVTNREKKQRIVAKKIIRKLIPLGINYRVVFPWKSSNSNTDLICRNLDCNYHEKTWGWTDRHKSKDEKKDKYVISIPRKAFFLPRDEFVDTTVHEPTHTLVWEAWSKVIFSVSR